MKSGKTAIFFLSALGVLFCLLNAGGAELLCLSSGCAIYSGYGLFGLSFYVYGAAAFALIFLLALRHPRRPAGAFLYLVLCLTLLLDAFFLGYQYLFWPCSSCLVIAGLLGVIALAAVSMLQGPSRLLKALLLVWIVFLTYGVLAAVKEVAFKPWPLFESEQASVEVYFSPVCPACRETVLQILRDPDLVRQTSFYPVVKNSEDSRRLARYLRTGGREGGPDRLAGLFEEGHEEEFTLTWEERRRLLANKIALARQGADTVPFVRSSMLPRVACGPEDPPVESSPFLPPSDSLFAPPGEGCSPFITAPDCE